MSDEYSRHVEHEEHHELRHPDQGEQPQEQAIVHLPDGTALDLSQLNTWSEIPPEMQQAFQQSPRKDTSRMDGMNRANLGERYVPPSWVDGKPPAAPAKLSNFGTQAEHIRDEYIRTQEAPKATSYATPHATPTVFDPRMRTAPAAGYTPKPTAYVQPMDQMMTSAPDAKTHERSVEGIAFDLPSGFAPYHFKKIYLARLRGAHMSKLTAAINTGVDRMFAEVLDTVMYTDIDPPIMKDGRPMSWASQLIPADYYFCLYMLHKLSFPKTKYRFSHVCMSKQHIDMIQKKILPPESIHTQSVIDLDILEYTTIDWPDLNNFQLEYPNAYVAPYRMCDIFEAKEQGLVDENGEYLPEVEIALGFRCGGATLTERVEMARDMSPEDWMTVLEYDSAVNKGGLNEKVKVICKGCGAETEENLDISAHNFLPDRVIK